MFKKIGSFMAGLDSFQFRGKDVLKYLLHPSCVNQGGKCHELPAKQLLELVSWWTEKSGQREKVAAQATFCGDCVGHTQPQTPNPEPHTRNPKP